MEISSKKAFTMIELVFVIVVIGILSAVAIPKFALTRDDAVIAKTKAQVGSIRSAVATERQKRILRGEFTPIYKLSSANGTDADIFDAFDGNTSNRVLQYPPRSCKNGTAQGCWKETTTGTSGSPISEYTYKMPVVGSVIFELKDNRFDCKTPTNQYCIELTR
jgi:general secretion pathway protein G